jgi:hypothetical protein
VSARAPKTSNFNPIAVTLVRTSAIHNYIRFTADLCGIDVVRNSTIIYNLIRGGKPFVNEADIPNH